MTDLKALLRRVLREQGLSSTTNQGLPGWCCLYGPCTYFEELINVLSDTIAAAAPERAAIPELSEKEIERIAERIVQALHAELTTYNKSKVMLLLKPLRDALRSARGGRSER